MNKMKNSRSIVCVVALIALCGVGDSNQAVPRSADQSIMIIERITPQGRACQQAVLMLTQGSVKQGPVQVPRELAGSWAEIFAPGVIVVLNDEDEPDYNKPIIYNVAFKDGGEGPEGYTSYIHIHTKWRWNLEEVRFTFVYSRELGLEMRAIDHIGSAVE